jgi:hypothetical protein
MKAYYTCPYCAAKNACDCESCKEFIIEGEWVNKWTPDGEGLICDCCKSEYSPDQALDAEYEEKKHK